MAMFGLSGFFSRIHATAWGAARSPVLCDALRTLTSPGGKSEPAQTALKKPGLPLGRFDTPEGSQVEQELLTKFPDDVNPITKEKGGPRGPEPTRYGDWERKGRCIDF